MNDLELTVTFKETYTYYKPCRMAPHYSQGLKAKSSQSVTQVSGLLFSKPASSLVSEALMSSGS